MPLTAREDTNRRRAVQPALLDIPSTFGKQRMARGRETGRVRHLASGDEREARIRTQSEDFFQPAAGNLFDNRRRGSGSIYSGILIPGSSEPIGHERIGQ